VIFLQITKIILERNGNLGIFVSDGLVYVGLKPYAIIVRPFRAFGFSECPLSPLRLRSVTVLPRWGEGVVIQREDSTPPLRGTPQEGNLTYSTFSA